MRILNVSAQKPDGTGSGTYLSETVAAEVAAGHRAAVICGISATDRIASLPAETAVLPVRFDTPELPFHVCGMSDEMPYPATRYRDLTPAMLAAFDAAFSDAIGRAVRDFRPDVILCHHLYLVSAIVREHVRDVPVGAICHATDLRQMAMHGLERDRIRAAMRSMDALFTLHAEQACQVVETYGADAGRVHVTGTGYNARLFDAGEGREQRRPGKITFVGKVSFKKGVESLLEAIDLIGPEYAPAEGVELVLVGGHDPASADWQRIADRAQRCRWPVYLPGRVPHDVLVHTYRTSDVFVLPSFYEGLPLVGIEAMACGAKVVMSDLPGVRAGMESLLPGNPMRWVGPPAMVAVDTPDPAALPAYESRLARALLDAMAAPSVAFDTTPASWDAVLARMIPHLRPFAE